MEGEKSKEEFQRVPKLGVKTWGFTGAIGRVRGEITLLSPERMGLGSGV